MTHLDLAVSQEITCKIVIIGDSGVGKTSVIRRFANNEFSFDVATTLGQDFRSRLLKVGSNTCRLQMWDTAGAERFRSISSVYFRGVNGAIIAYDITNNNSFNNVKEWMGNFDQLVDAGVPKLLIGNKCDLKTERKIEKAEGEKLAKASNMLFGETSAKDNINIEHVFMKLVENMIDMENNNTRMTQKRNSAGERRPKPTFSETDATTVKPQNEERNVDVTQDNSTENTKKKCC
ncbi:unnamed protein product [Clavelina lepadiformis]|uniref:Uncharacterized protein n=1 Tax=Clavelina lepadiformis TaxID=159417 RepID=A0ABP0GV11_CLALP